MFCIEFKTFISHLTAKIFERLSFILVLPIYSQPMIFGKWKLYKLPPETKKYIQIADVKKIPFLHIFRSKFSKRKLPSSWIWFLTIFQQDHRNRSAFRCMIRTAPCTSHRCYSTSTRTVTISTDRQCQRPKWLPPMRWRLIIQFFISGYCHMNNITFFGLKNELQSFMRN